MGDTNIRMRLIDRNGSKPAVQTRPIAKQKRKRSAKKLGVAESTRQMFRATRQGPPPITRLAQNILRPFNKPIIMWAYASILRGRDGAEDGVWWSAFSRYAQHNTALQRNITSKYRARCFNNEGWCVSSTAERRRMLRFTRRRSSAVDVR